MATPKKYNIPITKQTFGQEEMLAVQKPLETGWVVQGPYVKKFEEEFSKYTGAQHSIAASSCTTALHMAVAALGLKSGDEVIVPAFTWISTANVVEYMGAKPIFCDIELGSFNLDPKQLESLITPRTVGIIPVHLFGLCADMDAICDIAKKRGLWIVEDAACGFGAWWNGKHSGTFGEFGCFSFHPRKSITTGEGGMVTTERSDFADRSRSLRDHGASRSDLARHNAKAAFLLAEYNMLGYNYRMTDIQGALGCAQIARADSILEARRTVAKGYDQRLTSVDWLTPPHVPSNAVHGYQSYVCLFRPEEPTWKNVDRLNDMRNDLLTSLEEIGISTRQGTHAPVILGYYANKYGLKREQFPNAYFADRLSLTLPLYPQMSADEQDIVIKYLQLPR